MTNEHHKKRKTEQFLRKKPHEQHSISSFKDLITFILAQTNHIFQIDVALLEQPCTGNDASVGVGSSLAQEYFDFISNSSFGLVPHTKPESFLTPEFYKSLPVDARPTAFAIDHIAQDIKLSLDIHKHLIFDVNKDEYQTLGILGQCHPSTPERYLVALDLNAPVPQRSFDRFRQWPSVSDEFPLTYANAIPDSLNEHTKSFSILCANTVPSLSDDDNSPDSSKFKYVTNFESLKQCFGPTIIEKNPQVTPIRQVSLTSPSTESAISTNSLSLLQLQLAASESSYYITPFQPEVDEDDEANEGSSSSMAEITADSFRAYGLFHPYSVISIVDHYWHHSVSLSSAAPISLLISVHNHKAAPCHKPVYRSPSQSHPLWTFPYTRPDMSYGYTVLITKNANEKTPSITVHYDK